jgi:hypothetical protein
MSFSPQASSASKYTIITLCCCFKRKFKITCLITLPGYKAEGGKKIAE